MIYLGIIETEKSKIVHVYHVNCAINGVDFHNNIDIILAKIISRYNNK
jgi:hypothetical protein